MPQYDVVVSRTLTLFTTVTVSAKDEGTAEKKACQMAQDAALTWDIKDNLSWDEESDEVHADSIDLA